jgi:hypothetical protein
MTVGSGASVDQPVPRRSLILGLGRPQERRLLAACREDSRLRIAARCSSASEVLASIQQSAGDVALLDECLHLLDDEHLGLIEATGIPFLLLAREPDVEPRGTTGSIAVLSAEAEAAEVLAALANVHVVSVVPEHERARASQSHHLHLQSPALGTCRFLHSGVDQALLAAPRLPLTGVCCSVRLPER